MVMMLSLSLSSVGNRYPAVYVASYVGRKCEVRKCRQRDLKMLGCFVINLLNNYPAQSRGISSDIPSDFAG